MKHYLHYILLLFHLLLLVSYLSVVVASPAKKQFVLVLDAGHGGKDPGARGQITKEKDINLAVTLFTGKYISEKYPDIKVIYTRADDKFVGLNERAEIANKSHADLFISIHTNASPSSQVQGSEVYAFGVSRTKENLDVAKRENAVILLEDNYKEKYEGFDPHSSESYIIFEFMQNKFMEQSLDFASNMQNELKKCVRWHCRGVKQAEYLVLRKLSMPRILIELDFITNQTSEILMTNENGQKKYAYAIFIAFAKYKDDYNRKNGIRTQSDTKKLDLCTQRQKLQQNVTEMELGRMETSSDKKGVIYKVQILSVPNKLPIQSPSLKGYEVDYYVENNLYKYTYGESSDLKEIARIRQSLLKDFKDAFIVVFKDGNKIR